MNFDLKLQKLRFLFDILSWEGKNLTKKKFNFDWVFQKLFKKLILNVKVRILNLKRRNLFKKFKNLDFKLEFLVEKLRNKWQKRSNLIENVINWDLKFKFWMKKSESWDWKLKSDWKYQKLRF